VFNNLVVVDGPGRRLAILEEAGTVRLHHNCFKPGWKDSHGALAGDVLARDNSEGEDAGFRDLGEGDFRLREQSIARDRGCALPDPLAAAHPLQWEIVPPQSFRRRPDDGNPDIGAFEFP
jgi:hypothetical protein